MGINKMVIGTTSDTSSKSLWSIGDGGERSVKSILGIETEMEREGVCHE